LYEGQFIMAQTTFQGPVRSLGGFYQQGPAAVVAITSSTTLNPAAHGGRIITVGGSLAATTTLTLPRINVSSNPITSGPGQDPNTLNNEGVSYTIWVPATITTSTLKIGTTPASGDFFIGSLLGVDTDSSDAVAAYHAFASDTFDFINLNGGTTGGVAGTWIQIVAVAANSYMVCGTVNGSGVVATPFSTT
jgi:hypothetical protein